MKITYQKALDELLNFPKWCGGGVLKELFEENRIALQELIDKETPMKPIELGDNKFSCKSCAMAFTVKNLKNRFLSHNYCHVCGQKLDWNTNDDNEQEEGFNKIGYILDNMLEHLLNHMEENGVTEQQEVSYIKSGLEIKVIVEFKEREDK